MSVFNSPLEWANEMERMMAKGEITPENYLTDLANAVVYVRETSLRDKEAKEPQMMICPSVAICVSQYKLSCGKSYAHKREAKYCGEVGFPAPTCPACIPYIPSSEPQKPTLEERVARLEKQVEFQRERINGIMSRES